MTPQLYVDMDGVLADFQTAATGYFAINPRTEGKAFNTLWQSKDGWPRLMREWPTFWMDLPMMPHAAQLWTLVAPHHPSILTAIPEAWPSASTGKRIWCKRHLPKFGYHPNEQFHAVLRAQKAKFAKQPDGTPNILIDDLAKNIQEWQSAGGQGILYQDGNFTQIKAALASLR